MRCIFSFARLFVLRCAGLPLHYLRDLLFGGLILCSLGVIGEYLARIYLEVKRRPIFLVAETNIIPGPAETSGPLEG